MFWIPMAIGAAAGALTNKKNPLEGALMGGALGAAGGAAAPMFGAASGGAAGMAGATGSGVTGGLLGTSAAAAAPTAGMTGALGSGISATAGGLSPMALAGGASPIGSAGMSAMGGVGSGIAGSVAPSLTAGVVPQSAGLLSQVKDVASAGGQVVNAASAVKNLTTTQPKQLIGPSPIQAPMPNSNLGNIVQGMQQQQMAQSQNDFMQRDARRKQRIGLLA